MALHPRSAAAMTDRENDINGICLRGKAGWGEGGAFITVDVNSFGARWFDEDWNAQFDQPEWAERLNFYVNMMTDSGPAGYATNGFNENLSLFNQGKCGMWIDATVAASFVTKADDSTVADSVGFALAPDQWSWQALELALGLGAGHSCRHSARSSSQAVHRMGDRHRLHRAGCRQRRLGQRASGRTDIAV